MKAWERKTDNRELKTEGERKRKERGEKKKYCGVIREREGRREGGRGCRITWQQRAEAVRASEIMCE